MLDSPMAVLFRDSYHDLAIWGYEMHRTGWDLIGHSTYRPFIFQGSRHDCVQCWSCRIYSMCVTAYSVLSILFHCIICFLSLSLA